MKKVVIVYNRHNELASSVQKQMEEWLCARGFRVSSCDPHSTDDADLPVDFAVSLGGDGTFLSCARLLSRRPVPVLPVHLGTFGFITEVTHNEWEQTLNAWIQGHLEVENRMVLDITVRRCGKDIQTFTAVNDAVTGVSGISKIVRLSLRFGGFEAGHFRGDGVILSTPTGSTAYSMAAGGPILVPQVPALVFTPISPFSLSWRPMVIPFTDGVTVLVDQNQRADVLLTVDGQVSFPLKEHDEITLKGRQAGVLVIKSERRVFYEVIRSKLGWSGGPHA